MSNLASIGSLQIVISFLYPKNDCLTCIALLHTSLASAEHSLPILPLLLSGSSDHVQEVSPATTRFVAERWLRVARHSVCYVT